MSVAPANPSVDELDYDAGQDGYRVVPSEGARLATAIVTAVASVDDRSIESVQRLHRSIDPEALEALFDSSDEGAEREVGTVTFPLGAFTITVEASGEFFVERRARAGGDRERA